MRCLLMPLLLAACCTSAAAGSPAGFKIEYDQQATPPCTVKDEVSAELRERLPEFRQLWEAVGPAMVRAVATLTNKSFAPRGTVRLTLCDVPSNSLFGISVNMRYALRSFTPSPVPMRYKVDTLFHEALHKFIDQSVPATSKLLASHASEPRCVRNHLHLLALQKAVLLKLEDSKALEQVIAIDSQLPSGCYKRAWLLVNETEAAYRQYVQELAQ